VGHPIWVLLEIYCCLQQWKNFANRSRIDKVIAMVRVSPFFDSRCRFEWFLYLRSNLLARLSWIALGNSKQNNDWQYLTRSILPNWNSLIKNLFTTKSSEFKLVFNVRYMLSPVRLSSVCRLSSVTLVHPTQAIVIFGNISTALGTVAIHWHPLKISRRSSKGNPSAGGVEHKRGSKT